MRKVQIKLDDHQRAWLLRALEAQGRFDTKLRMEEEHDASDVHQLIIVAMDAQKAPACSRRDYTTASAVINRLTDIWIALVAGVGKQLDKGVHHD